MVEHADVIPVAVVVAIGIFLAREGFEFVRRYKTNARKLQAVRQLIAAECERNKFAIGRMLDQINAIAEGLKKSFSMSIEETRRGVPRLVIRDPEEEAAASSPLHLIQTATTEKYLFEAASLDKRLFALMEKALDGLTEAKHVREGVLEYVAEQPFRLEGFTDHYAPRELNDALEAVQNLYLYCTGTPLTTGRVR